MGEKENGIAWPVNHVGCWIKDANGDTLAGCYEPFGTPAEKVAEIFAEAANRRHELTESMFGWQQRAELAESRLEDARKQIAQRDEAIVAWEKELAESKAELASIKRDVPTLHERKCWMCGGTHWHADYQTPYGSCPTCGGHDTRRLPAAKEGN